MRGVRVIFEGLGQPRSYSVPWYSRVRLFWGKLRRAYLVYLRPGYVRESLKRRVGECARTGACCHLSFSCPMIRWLERTPVCRIYEHRPRSCTTFPIDERDLRDRDILFPEASCGFHFLSPEDARQASEESRRLETVSHP